MVLPRVVSAMEAEQRKDAGKELEQFLSTKDLAGISLTPIVASGDAVPELRRIVQENRIELAVISTHGRTGFRHLLMGSVAEELFRSLPCPVLTIGPNVSRGFTAQNGIKHILFPTDLSLESKAVFPYLAVVAAEYKSVITVLYVVPAENHRHPSTLDEAQALRAEIQRMFCSQTDPRCQLNTIVEPGNPIEQILAHAREDRVDLIGFGVRKATEISTHFRNTIPYKIVLQAECPVLTAHFGDGW